MNYDLKQIFGRFQIDGTFLNATRYGSGHINDTFAVNYRQGGRQRRYIFQRINHNIFKNPPELMDNIGRVTQHIGNKLESAGAKDRDRRVLTLVPADEGQYYHRDTDGNYWRAYIFIEDASTYDILESLDMAYEAAKTFGEFQCMLADMPQPPLHDTIPDFHNGPKRFEAFEKTLEADCCNRAKEVRYEIDFIQHHRWVFDVFPKLIAEGEIPIRITHNDTKITATRERTACYHACGGCMCRCPNVTSPCTQGGGQSAPPLWRCSYVLPPLGFYPFALP